MHPRGKDCYVTKEIRFTYKCCGHERRTADDLNRRSVGERCRHGDESVQELDEVSSCCRWLYESLETESYDV